VAQVFGLFAAFNDESAAKVAYEAMAGWLPLRVPNHTAGDVVSVSLFPPVLRRTDEQWIVDISAHEASSNTYWFAAEEMSDIGRRLYDLLNHPGRLLGRAGGVGGRRPGRHRRAADGVA
jgi:hypothetical protein